MNISNLAEKYVADHNNPIYKKSELFGSKLFLTPLNEQQEEHKEKCLTGIENILKHDRVDRRVARSTAEWIPEQNLAKVIKKIKITGASGFGIQNRNIKFLNAEETLFLMEINKLELSYKNIPMSIEEAYKNITDLGKYLAYKKLALQGYKLKSGGVKECESRENKSEKSIQQVEEITEPPTKIAKVLSDEEQDFIEGIFERLREIGPRRFEPNETTSRPPDYYVNNPKTTEKTEPFDLIVESEEDFVSNEIDDKNVNIHALSCDDDVAFYKFYNADIPTLL